MAYTCVKRKFLQRRIIMKKILVLMTALVAQYTQAAGDKLLCASDKGNSRYDISLKYTVMEKTCFQL